MRMITLLGLVAATFTTISFLPQAIKTLRTKNTADLSLGMYIVLTTGIILWLIYGILIRDLPVILANGITLIFTSSILFLIIKYKTGQKHSSEDHNPSNEKFDSSMSKGI